MTTWCWAIRCTDTCTSVTRTSHKNGGSPGLSYAELNERPLGILRLFGTNFASLLRSGIWVFAFLVDVLQSTRLDCTKTYRGWRDWEIRQFVFSLAANFH